jgi:exo-1,4-beta-D-glucosaminidase
MLNNAWPSMIWHLYDYYLDAGAGYYATKKACEPLHIQYSYDDHSIIVVNSTYKETAGLHATVQVHSQESDGWKSLYSIETTIESAADSSVRAGRIPDALYARAGQILFLDLSLSNSAGEVVSKNFYWIPTTLTTFDFPNTDYTHTPASQYENLSALTRLPVAQVKASALLKSTGHGSAIHLHLENNSSALAFQVSAAMRTQSGGLIAPVFWSDNWIELAPGESRTLTARFSPNTKIEKQLVIQLNGWNIAPQVLAVTASAQSDVTGFP